MLAVSGAQVTVGLIPPAPGSTSRATVGKFLGIVSGGRVIVGLITEIAERPLRDQDPNCRSTARIDLVGEIKANAAGAAHFQRGITEYPMIGEPAMLMSDRELRLIYNGDNAKPSNVGVLQQDPTIAGESTSSSSSASTSPSSARPASANRTASPSCSSKSWTSGRTFASS